MVPSLHGGGHPVRAVETARIQSAPGGRLLDLLGAPRRSTSRLVAGIVLGTQAVVLDPLAVNPAGATITNLCAGRVGT